jgi:hypothetical protein
MKYVLAYYGGGLGATEEEQAGIMQKWFGWFGSLGPDMVDGGLPFSGTARTLASDGSATDGAIGTPATGYSIITADNIDAATEKAKGCPVLETGGQITVYETVDMATG